MALPSPIRIPFPRLRVLWAYEYCMDCRLIKLNEPDTTDSERAPFWARRVGVHLVGRGPVLSRAGLPGSHETALWGWGRRACQVRAGLCFQSASLASAPPPHMQACVRSSRARQAATTTHLPRCMELQLQKLTVPARLTLQTNPPTTSHRRRRRPAPTIPRTIRLEIEARLTGCAWPRTTHLSIPTLAPTAIFAQDAYREGAPDFAHCE